MPEKPEPNEPTQPAEPPQHAEPKVRTLDARALRGLAHPLRMRLLAALRHDGPATASQLAEQLGESSGATSYHLRQLAAHGFVEDAPEHGKGRERWWRAAHDGTQFDESLMYDGDPATRGAADTFLHEIATFHTQEVSTWLGDAHNWPREWRRSSELSDFTLRLTADQAFELMRRVDELVNSYRDLPPAEGMETVRVHTHAFPRRSRA
ncbi:helix-turn-helix domain-containing protein [Streptomyces sp. NBC_00249]|uniref:ArsR/SmtB family transcription factor n=1 Tax=Streptomyces sp. NBC_00249 TaxID=2975690 RepID=UPI00225A943F|nr:helix-turn-helix domain-containing protein [Streptomyces sp. NBC_00249]MCX5198439.1 helix-turn-helix domain-containing protein [Streptomyces sp. NBC_00249]